MRMTWLLVSILLALIALPLRAEVLQEAQRWQRTVVREVHVAHGLDGPVALHGALIHQESSWRPGAESPVGAQGLAQIMPSTAEHIAEIVGRASIDPMDPRQAISGMAHYTAWIKRYIEPTDAPWAMTLSGYNGGIGWVDRDRDLAAEHGADPDEWWGEVEDYTRRSAAAERENRHYVRRIMLELQPRYLRAGWQGPKVCR